MRCGWQLAAGVVAILYGVISMRWILAQPAGNARCRKSPPRFRPGATAYLNRQYTTIAIVGVDSVRCSRLALGWATAGGFAVGADSVGPRRLHRHVHLRARERAHRAGSASRHQRRAQGCVPRRRNHRHAGGRPGAARASPAITSPCCASARRSDSALRSLVGLAFGGSLISIFARLGGGIFTKGADVGADFVGKVEAGIPEDDPRNPAVIADNVGDNVGDCAGMAADLFETYAVTLVATMLLGGLVMVDMGERAVLFPLVLGAISIVSSIVGTFFVSTRRAARS